MKHLILPILLGTAALSHAATTVPFVWFNGDNDQKIQLQATFTEDGPSTLVTIENLSSMDISDPYEFPTITKIFFDSPVPVNYVGKSGQVAFHFDTGINLPGGNTIAWDGQYSYSADSPVTKNGVDPYESVTFRLDNYSPDEDFRIAIHAQEINGGSGSFIATIPEPSTIMIGMTLGLLALRRKRTQ